MLRRRAQVCSRLVAGTVAALALSVAVRSAQASTTQRFALATLHFNIQYVEGGTYGLWPTPHTAWEVSDADLQDRIITQSFEPILDLLAKHPSWALDLEMQGYMLDVIGQRHPGVLSKLKALASSGQAEVISFHYADQFFIAHPYEDWARSGDLTRQTFASWGVPLSGVVFCQEEQSGAGMAAAMHDKGWSTLIFPKNLYSYQHGGGGVSPLYALGPGVTMVTTNDLAYDDGTNAIDLNWTFVDDGEKLATGGLDPYVAPSFYLDPSAVASYESSVAALEKQGYAITTVGKYVEAVSKVLTPAAAPPLLDGTWQPNSTDSSYRWLGGAGLHGPVERDDDNLSMSALAHRELEAAAAAATAARLDASAELSSAWRLLALGEGSDATGVNPIQGEAEYGIAYDEEALRIARDVIVAAKAAMGAGSMSIDPASGKVTPGDPTPAAPPATSDAPLHVVTASPPDRSATTAWAKVADQHWTLSVTFGAGQRMGTLSVQLPGTLDDIVYTPALLTSPVHLHRSDFTFDTYQLALTDGLLGLGGGMWVVMDQGWAHVGAQIDRTTGNVLFHDDTAAPAEQVTWKLHVLSADEATATALARSVNIQPEVWR